MPRKETKRLQESAENAVKIRCRYCDIKDSCSRRKAKESYENQGIVTYCTLTPNRKKKQKRQ